MNNVISLDRKRINKRIQEMKLFTKLELLEQMRDFQSEYNAARFRVIPKHLIYRGIPLFTALMSKADTEELRVLSGSYLHALNKLVDF